MSCASRGFLLSVTVLFTAVASSDNPVSPPLATPSRAVRIAPPARRDHVKALAMAPMVFEPNRGQADPGTAFVARGRGYAVEIADRRARLQLIADSGQAPAVLEMEVVGASFRARAVGADPQPGRSHYLVGSDPTRHLRDVPHLGSVDVRAVYPDIDLVYYGNQSDLEYDFRVRAGANPEEIALRFRGQDSLDVSPAGELIFRFGARELRHPRPVLYELPGRAPVEGRFVIADDGTVGFDVGEWDRTRTLVIDPTLVFGTYLGGTGNDTARAVAVDTAGNIYVGGTTASTSGFPLQGALQGTFGGGASDAFVTKFNATGTAIVYSTFVGSTGADEGRGIAVDSSGRVYLTGSTTGSIPSSSTTCLSSDGFVVRLEAAGNALGYSRCFGTGGTEWGNAIAVDGSANAYVTGLWAGGDAFVGKINATGTTFTNTILAGSSIEEGFGIAADAAGNVCVTGQTSSTNFPAVNARQGSLNGFLNDAFVAKYNSSSAVVFSTYLGGSSIDGGSGAAIDGAGNCYVTGSTISTDFPVASASQGASAGGGEAFITAYDATGSNYLYSTYLGGSRGEAGTAIAVSSDGIAHVSGYTDSHDFPAQAPTQPELSDLSLVLASPDAAGTFARTSLSGLSVTAIAADPTNGQIVYAGTTNGIYKSSNGGTNWARVDSGLTYTEIVALAIDPNAACTIYAGVNTTVANNQNTNGVLINSTNCGVNWGIPAGAPVAKTIRSLAFTLSNPSTLYMGMIVNNGTFAPDHRVARWTPGATQFAMPGLGNYVVAVDPQNACTAYAGDAGGVVFQSTSCAVFSWSQVGGTLTGLVNAVAVHPTNSATLLAGTTSGIIYRKADAGSAWAVAATPGRSINAIAYQPGNAQVVYAGSTNGIVYKSIDGGAVWSPTSVIGPAVTRLGVSAAAPNRVYAVTSLDSDAFYVRLSNSGVRLGATWIGGHGLDQGRGLALAPDGDAVLVGTSIATDFPAAGGLVTSSSGAVDSFIVKIGPNPPPNPVPSLTGLSPSSTGAGGPGFTLTVNGSSFVNGSQVRWNGAARATTFISNTQLQAAITAGDIAVAGAPSVTVFTAGPGGGTSTPVIFSVTSAPTMLLDRTSLKFGAVTTGAAFLSQTVAQIVRLTQGGSGTVTWAVTSNQPWLQVSPASGSGSANLSVSVVSAAGLPTSGTMTASLTLAFNGASNSAGPIAVTLTLLPNGTSSSPVGVVDTPANNTTGVTGAVPFTGWALDDVEVSRVMICRAAVSGETAPASDPNCAGASQIFVGFPVFIDGARPDVQVAYPGAPVNTKAGWGFMVLTNMLPSQGNGTYLFYVYAQDRDGHALLLGTRTMTCANASATKPFGAIDTPTQGGVASATNFVNFGWALTPQPKLIPLNGSTITVLVDGNALGTADYNHERGDIETLFPGYQNTAGANGAIGFRIIDTTLLTNGLHTISWTVVDDQGAIEGIGSRFFTVSNGAGSLTAVEGGASSRVRVTADVIAAAARDEDPILARRGWDLEGAWRWYGVGRAGRAVIRGEEIDRFELWLGDRSGERYTGHVRVGEELAPLPIGSQLDAATGQFTWAPGVGFVGSYDLVFVRWAGPRAVARHEVRIILAPKGRGHVGVQVAIDVPRAQQDVQQPFLLAGWAADLDAAAGTGIDTLHVWAYPATGGAPVFVGTPALGGVRPDVAAVHGDQFREAGFALSLQGLLPGTYDLAVFPWSNVTGAFAPPNVVRVTVR